MANHAVEIVSSTERKDSPATSPSPVDTPLPKVMPDRVQQNILSHINQQAGVEQVPVDSIPSRVEPGGESIPSHTRGLYRFEYTHDRNTIVQSMETGVLSDAKWYEVRYHSCDHDEDNGPGCGDWEVDITSGSVPSGV